MNYASDVETLRIRCNVAILQIGFAYAFGILFALIVCTSTSGGHFNPAITISAVIMHKMPPLKALR